jgi:hypothetical protein
VSQPHERYKANHPLPAKFSYALLLIKTQPNRLTVCQ